MNLRDLEYLVALDHHRHFHKAADACFVSQPTLSGQIKKLEQHLGVALLERGRRQKVLFTPIGETIVMRARRILQEAEAIEQMAQLAKDPLRGPLKLAVIPTLAPYLLPWLMPALKQHYPHLEILLYELQTAHLLSALAEGQIEMGLLALPLSGEQLHIQPFFEECFYLAVPQNHALAQHKQVQLSDLENETILLLDDGHCFRDQALDVCFKAGAHEKNSFRGTSLETLRQMVRAGSGITLLPALAVETDPHPQGIRYLPFSAPSPYRTIGWVSREQSARQDAFDELANTFSKWAAEPNGIGRILRPHS